MVDKKLQAQVDDIRRTVLGFELSQRDTGIGDPEAHIACQTSDPNDQVI